LVDMAFMDRDMVWRYWTRVCSKNNKEQHVRHVRYTDTHLTSTHTHTHILHTHTHTHTHLTHTHLTHTHLTHTHTHLVAEHAIEQEEEEALQRRRNRTHILKRQRAARVARVYKRPKHPADPEQTEEQQRRAHVCFRATMVFVVVALFARNALVVDDVKHACKDVGVVSDHEGEREEEAEDVGRLVVDPAAERVRGGEGCELMCKGTGRWRRRRGRRGREKEREKEKEKEEEKEKKTDKDKEKQEWRRKRKNKRRRKGDGRTHKALSP
jgi:hypothetical protein